MTGKERVLKAFNYESVDRTPWVPYAGIHTATLLGMDAETYLKNSDNMVNGIKKAYEIYQCDGLPIAFDLQIEAEALGCELKWAKNNPPAVIKHILEEKNLSELKRPTKDDGRYPLVLDASKRLVDALGDEVALYALICGPFTLASHLMGTNIFMDMVMNPDNVKKVLEFTTEVTKDFAKMYADTGVEIVASVDPMTTQISPEHYREYVSPYAQNLNKYVQGLGLKSVSFCCGDATKNFELMCQDKPDGIAFDENVNLAFARELASKYKLSIGGNLPLTTVMLFGSPVENINEAKAQIKIAGGEPGYILSPGCDIPFDTPLDNMKALSAFARGDSVSLEFLAAERQYQKEEVVEELEKVVLEKGKAFIEIITLDSEGCAPCQYMMETVRKAEPFYGDKLSYRETLIKSKAGINRVIELGLTNLPSILINNELVYDNIIPSVDQLKEEIDKRL